MLPSRVKRNACSAACLAPGPIRGPDRGLIQDRIRDPTHDPAPDPARTAATADPARHPGRPPRLPLGAPFLCRLTPTQSSQPSPSWKSGSTSGLPGAATNTVAGTETGAVDRDLANAGALDLPRGLVTDSPLAGQASRVAAA